MAKLNIGEDTSLDMVDATQPLKYYITKAHIWGSDSKAKNLLTMCVNERAILSLPNVLDVRFYRTVAYVIRTNNPRVAIRYIPSNDGKRIAEINDAHGKKGLLKAIDKPIELWLEPPRYNRSLVHTRSPEMKEARKKSAEKRRGQPKRSYISPSSKGFRNGSGSGKAHMWTAR